MRRPTVSVLIATYNSEKYIDEAIESVLQQTLRDFELIVVNDGSTDGTREQLRKYEEMPRITIIDQQNSGPAAARNRAFQASTGEFIAILDADDRNHPARLEIQSQRLRRDPQLGLVGAFARKITPSGKPLEILEVPTSYDEIAARIDQSSQFVHATVMIRRDIFKALGGYREDYPASEDYEFLRRATHDYRAANIPKVLYDYRIHAESNTFYALEQQKLYGLLTRHLAKTNRAVEQCIDLQANTLSPEILVDLGVPRRVIDEALFSSYKRRIRVLVGLGDLEGARKFLEKARSHHDKSILGNEEQATFRVYEIITRPNAFFRTVTRLAGAIRTSPSGTLLALREWGHFGVYRIYDRFRRALNPPR